MGIDLILQCLHACLKQQTFLLLQFDLNAYAVKDLQLNTDHRRRGGVNDRFYPGDWALQAESCAREKVCQFGVDKTKRHDRDKEHELPVE